MERSVCGIGLRATGNLAAPNGGSACVSAPSSDHARDHLAIFDRTVQQGRPSSRARTAADEVLRLLSSHDPRQGKMIDASQVVAWARL